MVIGRRAVLGILHSYAVEAVLLLQKSAPQAAARLISAVSEPGGSAPSFCGDESISCNTTATSRPRQTSEPPCACKRTLGDGVRTVPPCGGLTRSGSGGTCSSRGIRSPSTIQPRRSCRRSGLLIVATR